MIGQLDTYLLTGSTGFVGSRVFSALEASGAGVYRLVRAPTQGGESIRIGAVEDAKAVDRAMQGVSCVIHCAAYLGADRERQQRVNVDGTRNLIGAARRAGISRFICLSTSGVYGGTLGEGLPEEVIPVRPATELSRSRSEAERLVLDAGGISVRPNIVYGIDDRLVIPVVLRAMVDLQAWIGAGGALISAIPVDMLGQLIAALAIESASPGVYHASFPAPIAFESLIAPLYEEANLRLPVRSITPEVAAKLHPGVSARLFNMIARDNWYDSGKIWAATRTPVDPTIITAEVARYYSRVLTRAASTFSGR